VRGWEIACSFGRCFAKCRRVEVELPKQMPVRLVTLQKACVAAVFEANPAECPAASIVGHAMVITPLLPVPLEGPGVFCFLRRSEVPGSSDRPTRLRRYDRTVRGNLYQQSVSDEYDVRVSC
jgi:hypothetical protein